MTDEEFTKRRAMIFRRVNAIRRPPDVEAVPATPQTREQRLLKKRIRNLARARRRRELG